MVIDASVIYAFGRIADNYLTIKAKRYPDICTVPYRTARQSKMTYGFGNVLKGTA